MWRREVLSWRSDGLVLLLLMRRRLLLLVLLIIIPTALRLSIPILIPVLVVRIVLIPTPMGIVIIPVLLLWGVLLRRRAVVIAVAVLLLLLVWAVALTSLMIRWDRRSLRLPVSWWWRLLLLILPWRRGCLILLMMIRLRRSPTRCSHRWRPRPIRRISPRAGRFGRGWSSRPRSWPSSSSCTSTTLLLARRRRVPRLKQIRRTVVDRRADGETRGEFFRARLLFLLELRGSGARGAAGLAEGGV